MKKVIAVIMSIMLLAGILVSCADNRGGGDTTAAPAGDTTADASTDFVPSNIPESLRFDDTTISFLYWKDVERPEFFVDDISGEPVNDAIYSRNSAVEKRFGIMLEWEGTEGNYGNQNNFVEIAFNSAQSGGDEYDIFAGYSLTGATLAQKGLSQNLKDYSILEFDKPWWPESLISQATINDKLYFASGDISTNLLYMMYSCFFNKNMYDDIHPGGENIYDTVINHEWTVDKMIELSDGCYRDLNTNNQIDYEDQFGFMTIDLHFDCFFTGANLKTLEKDDAGLLVISEDFASEKTMNLLQRVNAFLYNDEDAFAKGTTSTYSSATAFRDNRALFTVDRCYIASGTLKESLDFEYGILPVPMYDNQQENYVTCMAFPFTLYSLSTASRHPEAAAATLELMAYQSYLMITPALFEESMKLKYSSELRDAQMYDIIHDTIYVDIGRIFSTSLNNITYQSFRSAMKNNTADSWVVVMTAQNKTLKRLITEINTTMSALQ